MTQASHGDLRTIANGLFPTGGDLSALPKEGKDEIRAAIEVILKLWDHRNTKLALALEQLDRAADAIEQRDEIIRWVESWVSNPVGAYSVHALDGLFGMTRDKIAALKSANPA